MATQDDLQLGRTAVRMGYLETKQLATCLQIQKELLSKGRSFQLSQIFLKKGLLSTQQLDEVMKASRHGDIDTQTRYNQPPNKSFPETKVRALPTERYLDRYQILDEIARGGMGRVYRAHDEQLDRIVALKKLLAEDDEENVERFLREAKATARLDHPNIVKVYELGQQDGQYFFIMDYVEGETLHSLAQKGKLTLRQIAEIMIKVGNAVQYAHDQGIIHRDLKPGNIMVGSDNEPKVMDFGLAKITQENSKLSQSGVVLGTLQYMPPEQAEGRLRAIDVRSDVYSLGAILYEMLTGKPPFLGTTFSQVLDQVINKVPLPPSQIKKRVSKPIETICLKALEKDKKNRYNSAKEMAEDIKRFLGGKKVKAHSRNPLRELLKQKKIVIGIVVAIMIILPFFFIGGKKQSARKRNKNSTKNAKKKQKERKKNTHISSKTGKKLKMIAKLVNQNNLERKKFKSDEKIQVEVNWKLDNIKENTRAQVEVYGENLQYREFPMPTNKRKYYCPLELTTKRGGHYEVTVRLTIGEYSRKQVLTFYIAPPVKPLITRPLNVKVGITNEQKKLQESFFVGDKIFLEVDFGGPAPLDMQPMIEIRGTNIKNIRYNLTRSKKIYYFAIPLGEPHEGDYEIKVALLFKNRKTLTQNLKFTLLPKQYSTRIDFDILDFKFFNTEKIEKEQFSHTEEVNLQLRWEIRSVPENLPQYVEFKGLSAKPVIQKIKGMAEAKKYTLSLNLKPPKNSPLARKRVKLKVTARVIIGAADKEITKELIFE